MLATLLIETTLFSNIRTNSNFLLHFLMTSFFSFSKRGRQRTACIIIWPDGQPTDSNMDFA